MSETNERSVASDGSVGQVLAEGVEDFCRRVWGLTMTEDSIPCLQAKIAALRASRDEWMDRSNAHALAEDRYREEVIQLKGRLWEMERDMKAKDIVLQCAREALTQADKLAAELASRTPAEPKPCTT